MWQAIRRHVLDKLVLGALVWVPLYVTFQCLFILFKALGANVVLLLGLFYLTGWIFLGKTGKWVLGGLLAFLAKIPILAWVTQPLYLWVKTLVFERGQMINKLVLIQFPMPGAWTIGIILRQFYLCRQPYFCIFIPTLINPLTGYTTFSPREFIYETPMSYGDGVKMLMSVGVLAPERVF